MPLRGEWVSLEAMPQFPDDTIAAVSTPPGEGGIGIVRLSGPKAIEITDTFFVSRRGIRLSDVPTHTIHHGFIIDGADMCPVDEVLVSVMRAPRTYTREDVVEINCHGGSVPLARTLRLALGAGVRLAEPGEFTKRAFLNGRIDLSQAEAVMDLIHARTAHAERLAMEQLRGALSERVHGLGDEILDLCAHVEAYIDFPDEDIPLLVQTELLVGVLRLQRALAALSKGFDEGRLYREGAAAAIVGKPNVGKSSLLNALLNEDRAIVTELPGTTRDVIEESLNICGIPLRIMDTAGIRETHDLAEQEGVRRSLRALDGADIVLAVLDAARPLDDADRELLARIAGRKAIVVLNKIDQQLNAFDVSSIGGCACRRADSSDSNIIVFPGGSTAPLAALSAKTGEGLQELKHSIRALLVPSDTSAIDSAERQTMLVTNIRHREAIDDAVRALERAYASIQAQEPPEIVALSLREARDALGFIVGFTATEDILDRIFSRFCIGK